MFKMNSAVTFIYYSTYLGGSGTMAGELANAIAADASGNAYVGGCDEFREFSGQGRFAASSLRRSPGCVRHED